MKAHWAILAIFLIQGGLFINWVASDSSNPSWDEAWHAMISLNMLNQMKGGIPTADLEQSIPIFQFANNYYSHLYHLLSIPFYTALGEGFKSGIYVNLLFLAMLVFSGYMIGKKYSPFTGVLLAAMLSAVPLSVSLMTEFLLDFPLYAMVCLGYYLLIYSENFSERTYSLLFGAAVGFGILIKWTYPIFLAMPIAFAIGGFVKNKGWETRYYMLAVPLILAILITLFGYGGNIQTVYRQSIMSRVAELDPAISFSYYGHMLFSWPTVLYILLLALSLAIKSDRKTIIYILFPYFVFSIAPNKDVRYILPIFVFITHHCAFSLSMIKMSPLVRSGMVFIFLAIFISSIPDPQAGTDISMIANEVMDGSSLCIASENPDVNDVNVPYILMRSGKKIKKVLGNGCNPFEYDYTLLGPIEKTWRSGSFERTRTQVSGEKGRFDIVYSGQGYELLKLR
ncbi:MAG: hypothetical protein HGA85_05365 [Nanoarchaeota archaeon]|nr:hypothetical protein [Nanoarchaeota archaeon]